MVRRQTVFNHNVFLKTSRLNFILEKSNIAKSLLTLSNTNNMYTLNQLNKIHEMQILQLQKHRRVSTVGAMGVPLNSGKNCSNFDHITMARMAEQRLNNL